MKNIQIELNEYCDEEHREYGATLDIDLVCEVDSMQYHDSRGYLVESEFKVWVPVEGYIFTYDQDGGESRSIKLTGDEVLEYVSLEDIQEHL